MRSLCKAYLEKMKNKAAIFFRKIATALMAIMRSKSMKSSKLIMFRLLRNKKVLMSALFNKLQSVIGDQQVLLMDDVAKEEVSVLDFVEDDDDYPDLRHSLFELNDDTGGSVTDWVRNGREDDESEVNLEDEIDQVADMFIRRFHRQMRLEEESISWY
ncbi:hypothetical protein ZIOFF_036103 [Zingiber officinale]|uniref:FHA domain-containing protein n=2 Tax=Zingiber officinale TaxID=94328 RepID=A0A8J5GHM6_ZINOF|nr:hypothetical protein ZIOFF_036103 [Zingiber officinale]